MFEGLVTPDDLEATNGNEALLAEQAQQARRRAALIEQAKASRQAIGNPAQPQMVTGRGLLVPPSKLQAFLPVIQQALTGLEQRALDQDATALDQRVAAAARQHWQSKPPEGAPQEAVLRWIDAGSRIPGMAQIMDKVAQDTLIAAPERQAQRQFRSDESAANRALREEQQRREIEYRQERDADRLADKEKDRDLRATLAAAVRKHSGGGGGKSSGEFKASDFVTSKDDQGNVVIINKLTREVHPVGAVGASAAAVTKEKIDQGEKRANASKALQDLDEAEKLLPLATGSKVGSIRDSIYGAMGVSSDGARAAAALEPIANAIVSSIPRMAGQVSDADLKFLQKQGGDLANKELPAATRLAALRQVRRIMERTANAQAETPKGSGPSIRQAVEAAANPVSDEALLNKYLKK
jgi:hypothetical protein